MTRLTRSIGALAATLALTGCTSLREPIVQFFHDSSTTTAIKTRLAMDGRPSTLAGIGVHTSDDVVRLTGTVASEAERQRVEAIARHVAGDNRVVSKLRVASQKE